MKSALLSLVSAVVMFAGISAIAGPPQTLYCNQTVYFAPLDCNGSASLTCGPNGALLSYNMTGCLYYTYDNGYATPISQVAPLQLNTIYRAKLTRTPEPQGQGTVLTINTAYSGPVNPPPPPPVTNPTPPPPPTCSADVVAAPQSRGEAVARVECSEPMATRVEVRAPNGTYLCPVNSQFAALPGIMGAACTFQRDPYRKLPWTVNVYDMAGNLMTSQSGTLYKEATYNFRPEGHFTSQLYQRSNAQLKKNPFSHGYFWKVTVSATVSDQDVDPSEGQQLIRVDLVNITTGKVLKSQMANSGQQVIFNLEHQQITSRGGHDTNEGLQRGHNVLKLKIYDAYNPQGEGSVVWPSQEEVVDLVGGA